MDKVRNNDSIRRSRTFTSKFSMEVEESDPVQSMNEDDDSD